MILLLLILDAVEVVGTEGLVVLSTCDDGVWEGIVDIPTTFCDNVILSLLTGIFEGSFEEDKDC
jgi:hypothetical protein